MVFLATNLGSTQRITGNFLKIKQWADVREITNDDSEVFGLLMDYPLFTALDKCHYLTCISVAKQPELSGEVQYMELPESTYLSLEVSGDINEMLKQVTVFWKLWLPDSGYQMVHEPARHVPKFDISVVSFEENTFRLFIKAEPK